MAGVILPPYHEEGVGLVAAGVVDQDPLLGEGQDLPLLVPHVVLHDDVVLDRLHVCNPPLTPLTVLPAEDKGLTKLGPHKNPRAEVQGAVLKIG